MVQFEEMIKSLELREVLLKFLEQHLHPMLLNNFGLDMDLLQARVLKELPPFTFTSAMIVCIVSAIYWHI